MAMVSRKCAACGELQGPWIAEQYATRMTCHEFNCYKDRPELVPEQLRDYFNSLLVWEKRSAAAKRGIATRRANRAAAQYANAFTRK
jgi:hypothetical protein